MGWAVIIIILSVAVAAVAKVLNNLNENNIGKNRPQRNAGDGSGGGNVRQTKSDMDRFLAEIDRLRKKNTESPSAAPNRPANKQAPVAPVVQPSRQSERPRARVVAEVAEPSRADRDRSDRERDRERIERERAERDRPDQGFVVTAPDATTGPKPYDLPTASVVTPPSGTGAPATRVTRIASRPRPVAKTPFAKSLTGLLNSGQGLALAIVLQEILGPPRGRRNG